jgi:hypothetical protein
VPDEELLRTQTGASPEIDHLTLAPSWELQLTFRCRHSIMKELEIS